MADPNWCVYWTIMNSYKSGAFDISLVAAHIDGLNSKALDVYHYVMQKSKITPAQAKLLATACACSETAIENNVEKVDVPIVNKPAKFDI